MFGVSHEGFAAHGEGASWVENTLLSGCEHCHDTVIEWDTGQIRKIADRDEAVTVRGARSSQTHMIVNMTVESGRTSPCDIGVNCNHDLPSLWSDVVNFMTEKEPVPLPYDEFNVKTYLMNCYDGVGGSTYEGCPTGPGTVDENCNCTGVVDPLPTGPDLTLNKTGIIYWGDTVPVVEYTITVNALGAPGSQSGGRVTLIDTNSHISFRGPITTTRGVCGWIGNAVDCSFGTMKPGDSAIVTLSGSLTLDSLSNINVATVSQANPEDDLSNNEVTLTLTAPTTTTSTTSSSSTTLWRGTTTSTSTTSTTTTTIEGGITRPTIDRPPRPPRPTVIRPSRPTVR